MDASHADQRWYVSQAFSLWASYSAAFGASALGLYRQAEATAALQ